MKDIRSIWVTIVSLFEDSYRRTMSPHEIATWPMLHDHKLHKARISYS